MRQKWDRIYQTKNSPGQIAAVLLENESLLPVNGNALELACGTGQNSCFLASRGLDVEAWDISQVAIDRLRNLAQRNSLKLKASTVDIKPAMLQPNAWDVIVCTHYLDRSLFPAMIAALRANGRIFFQTFSLNKPPGIGPSNPEFLLQPGELKTVFSSLEVLAYRDNSSASDPDNSMVGREYIVVAKHSL